MILFKQANDPIDTVRCPFCLSPFFVFIPSPGILTALTWSGPGTRFTGQKFTTRHGDCKHDDWRV